MKSRTDRSPAGNQICHLELPGTSTLWNWHYSPDYDLDVPEDLVAFCILVPDLYAFCNQLEQGHRNLAGELAPGNSEGKNMAFITDPDNYEVEL